MGYVAISFPVGSVLKKPIKAATKKVKKFFKI